VPGLTLLALVAAGAGAGVMNALAGGGTILTFPVLIWLGIPARIANATSTVALVPGAAASLAGYWGEVRSHRAWLRTLFLPSLLGGAAGSLLLLATPEKLFARLAPLLVFLATLLFAVQSWRARHRESDGIDVPAPAAAGRRLDAALFGQFAVAVYGGYFGAGIGILMLAILASLGLTNIHAMNGLKNFFGMAINGLAAAIFVVAGVVDWQVVLPVLAGSVAGGYLGARFGRSIGRDRARLAVIAIGVLVTVILAVRQI